MGTSGRELTVFDELPLFMTVMQAAEALQLGRSTAYDLTVEWERTGGKSGLPFVWLRCQKRIPRIALMRFAEQALPTPPGA